MQSWLGGLSFLPSSVRRWTWPRSMLRSWRSKWLPGVLRYLRFTDIAFSPTIAGGSQAKSPRYWGTRTMSSSSSVSHISRDHASWVGRRIYSVSSTLVCWHPVLVLARYQASPNPTHRIPRQGYPQVLPRAVVVVPKRSGKSTGCPEGAPRGQEAWAHPREGDCKRALNLGLFANNTTI